MLQYLQASHHPGLSDGDDDDDDDADDDDDDHDGNDDEAHVGCFAPPPLQGAEGPLGTVGVEKLHIN